MVPRVIPAMILAAGLGTRLRPLTLECPKPLVPVGGSPLLSSIVSHLGRAGAKVVVNAYHHREAIERFGHEWGVSISSEEELLGTAGGLRHAATLLGPGDAIVWNGDIVSSVEPRVLLDAKQERDDAVLLVKPRLKGEGNVGISNEGRVVRLRKETFFEGEARGGEFIGIHLVGGRLRDALPTAGCLVGDVYMPELAKGATLRAVSVGVPFIDVGTIDAYIDANMVWLEEGARDLFIEETAQIADGVSVKKSVVGKGAKVDAPIEEVVVWPGAHVRGPLRRALVTPHHIVRA